MSPQPRCQSCAIFLETRTPDGYEHCDPTEAPRYCRETGVTVHPMCFCAKYRPGNHSWRPVITLDDLAKIRHLAETNGIEIRLKYAPYGPFRLLPDEIISAGPQDCRGLVFYGKKGKEKHNNLSALWENIVIHWELGTVEWRPAP